MFHILQDIKLVLQTVKRLKRKSSTRVNLTHVLQVIDEICRQERKDERKVSGLTLTSIFIIELSKHYSLHYRGVRITTLNGTTRMGSFRLEGFRTFVENSTSARRNSWPSFQLSPPLRTCGRREGFITEQ